MKYVLPSLVAAVVLVGAFGLGPWLLVAAVLVKIAAGFLTAWLFLVAVATIVAVLLFVVVLFAEFCSWIIGEFR